MVNRIGAFVNGFDDLGDDIFECLDDLLIIETDDAEAESFDALLSEGIVAFDGWIVVIWAVEFDHKFMVGKVEIDDKAVDGLLAPDAGGDLVVRDAFPERFLGWSHFAAQPAGPAPGNMIFPDAGFLVLDDRSAHGADRSMDNWPEKQLVFACVLWHTFVHLSFQQLRVP